MVRISLLIFIMVFVQSCERRTQVRIEGGNPPVFVLSGSGKLGEVIVFGPQQEARAQSDPFDDTYAVWRIAAEKGGEDATPVEKLARLTYGIVPQGYTQVKPKTIGSPPPLVPGTRYRYWFITVNAPHASGYFEIKDGQAVSIEGP